MAKIKKIEWMVEQKYDRRRNRHVMNGQVTVLHCHHYATLYSQLADDATIVDGRALLRQASELSFHAALSSYFETYGIADLEDRVALAEEYWSLAGMGTLRFERVGALSASARMDHSHVDEGWIKKWGKREAPVNFIGQGYVSAAMAAVYDLPPGSFVTRETASIVAGADASRFAVRRA